MSVSSLAHGNNFYAITNVLKKPKKHGSLVAWQQQKIAIFSSGQFLTFKKMKKMEKISPIP